MNAYRTFWTGLVSLLLPMFSASDVSAAQDISIPEKGAVRYFHYWSECGKEAQSSNGLERIRFELQRNKIYFSQGRPLPDTFSCQTDGSLNRDIVPLLASLDIADWPGQMEEDTLYGLSDIKKRKLCRWHLCAVFEPETSGNIPLKICFTGADDGSSPKRLAAEQLFRDFFGPKLAILKDSTPRKLTELLWMTYGTSYRFAVKDNGIVTIERCKDSKSESMAVYPGLADELDSSIRASGLEKFHGFLQRSEDRKQDRSLRISFDTKQRIEIIGHKGTGGMPEGFDEAFAPLLRSMDAALEPPTMTKILPQTRLKSLSFRVSGMIIGEDICLYERMDKDGPVLVLNRTVGYPSANREEAVLDAEQLTALEALLKKHDVRSWNGFKGRPRMDVLDGEGFDFSLSCRDGKKIRASGENKFPSGYRAFRIALNTFVDRVMGLHK